MTINNQDAFMRALWDWAFLNPCFSGTKIRLCDIDGAVERMGHFLFIEAKGPNVRIPRGQQIFFDNLAKTGNTVIQLWGEPNKTEAAKIIYPGGKKSDYLRNATDDDVRNWVRKWREYAERNPKWKN